MEQNNNQKNLLLVGIGIILLLVFIYFSRRVLTPFFIAFALAYLLDPLADRLASRSNLSVTVKSWTQ